MFSLYLSFSLPKSVLKRILEKDPEFRIFFTRLALSKIKNKDTSFKVKKKCLIIFSWKKGTILGSTIEESRRLRNPLLNNLLSGANGGSQEGGKYEIVADEEGLRGVHSVLNDFFKSLNPTICSRSKGNYN